jgi:hypothetical protein
MTLSRLNHVHATFKLDVVSFELTRQKPVSIRNDATEINLPEIEEAVRLTKSKLKDFGLKICRTTRFRVPQDDSLRSVHIIRWNENIVVYVSVSAEANSTLPMT